MIEQALLLLHGAVNAVVGLVVNVCVVVATIAVATAVAVVFFEFEIVEPIDFVFENKAHDVDDKQHPTAKNHKHDCKHDAEHAFFESALRKADEVGRDVPEQTQDNLDDFVKTVVPIEIFFCKIFHKYFS